MRSRGVQIILVFMTNNEIQNSTPAALAELETLVVVARGFGRLAARKGEDGFTALQAARKSTGLDLPATQFMDAYQDERTLA